MPVNELSSTIDLSSTLLRSQALFRRFQRTVDAIDKKNNFPAPSVRQRKAAESSPADKNATQKPSNPNRKPVGAGTGSDARPVNDTEERDKAQEKVISPELRGLLSRKVEVLDKQDVLQHGGGL